MLPRFGLRRLHEFCCPGFGIGNVIALTPDEMPTVTEILARFLPGVEVRAFGSRTRHGHKRFSDLDLALMTHDPLSFHELAILEEAFSETDLAFRVDLLDWAATSETMKGNIAGQLVPLQAR